MIKLEYLTMGRSILGIRINQSKYTLLVNTLTDAPESLKEIAIYWVDRLKYLYIRSAPTLQVCFGSWTAEVQ